MQDFYLSEEAVQAAVYARVSVLKNIRCPVYKHKCIGPNCMSFFKGSYSSFLYQKETRFRINHKPKCDSPLVTGYIEMDITNLP